MAKREHETCLYGMQMGRKDDPRICLRGMLDATHAKTVLCAVTAREQGKAELEEKLENVARAMLTLLAAEYKGKMEGDILKGESEEKIRHASHCPEQVYGVAHFFPTAKTGRMIAELNVLRTEIRACERQAVAVFGDSFEPFIRALNRLSSYVYCLMCQQKAEQEEQTCR